MREPIGNKKEIVIELYQKGENSPKFFKAYKNPESGDLILQSPITLLRVCYI
jgi:hypothetical protein